MESILRETVYTVFPVLGKSQVNRLVTRTLNSLDSRERIALPVLSLLLQSLFAQNLYL
jgi:hypothetical protein